jgi:hypothetical protein
MAKTHTVKQGETLSSIALENGFRDFHTIFDHPENAELKALRDPHVLFPGDRLFIPDFTQKTVSRPVDNLHRFVAPIRRLLLRLRILDVNGKALANTACDVGLEAGQAPTSDQTDGKGVLEEAVSAKTRKGEVVAHAQIVPPAKKGEPPPDPFEEDFKFDLKIGHLNPEFKLSGQQARLNNLGYFAGFTLKDLDQLLWAAEEFACDKIAKPVTKRPKITPAPLQGEEDDSASDPKSPTGIRDGSVTAKLKAEHGI